MPFAFASQVVQKYRRDDCPMMAAGLAFYAVFSIPPLLFVMVHGAGTLLGVKVAQEGFAAQTGRLLGPEAAAQFSAMLQNATARTEGEGAAVLMSLAALLFAATGAFVQLQSSLNRVWGVRPRGDRPFVVAYLARRVASVGMMAALGILLLASLGLSTLLAAAGELLLGGIRESTLHVLDPLFNAAVFTVLFAAMFRWIPDAKIFWRDVWVGAAATMILFLAAKHGAAMYLGGRESGAPFPAAGSLTVFMLWVYFEAAALLLGAEFTYVWVKRRGRTIEPEDGAANLSLLHEAPRTDE